MVHVIRPVTQDLSLVGYTLFYVKGEGQNILLILNKGPAK